MNAIGRLRYRLARWIDPAYEVRFQIIGNYDPEILACRVVWKLNNRRRLCTHFAMLDGDDQ